MDASVGSDSGAGLSASLTAGSAVAVGSGFGSPMTSVRPLVGAECDHRHAHDRDDDERHHDERRDPVVAAARQRADTLPHRRQLPGLPGRPGGHPQGPVGVVLVLHEQHPIGPRLGDGVPVVSFGTPRISLEVLEDMRWVVAVVSDDPRWMWHLWDIPAWRGVVSVTRRVATP